MSVTSHNLCMCPAGTVRSVARNGRSTCSACGKDDAYGNERRLAALNPPTASAPRTPKCVDWSGRRSDATPSEIEAARHTYTALFLKEEKARQLWREAVKATEAATQYCEHAICFDTEADTYLAVRTCVACQKSQTF